MTDDIGTEGEWRVGHIGRDLMYYEEFRGGEWQRIMLDGEMLTGRRHHAIYLKHIVFPPWAAGRSEEIIARIKESFPESEYDHDEEH